MATYKNDAYYVSEAETGQIVKWDNKLATGIELIDSQHKELVFLTNNLYQACLSGGTGEIFRDAMKGMVEYVCFHFGAEQKFLERIRYPDYLHHKLQHDALIKHILDAAKDFNSGKQYVANNFVRVLRDWIFSHIAVHDKSYSTYVADQMRKGFLSSEEINC